MTNKHHLHKQACEQLQCPASLATEIDRISRRHGLEPQSLLVLAKLFSLRHAPGMDEEFDPQDVLLASVRALDAALSLEDGTMPS